MNDYIQIIRSLQSTKETKGDAVKRFKLKAMLDGYPSVELQQEVVDFLRTHHPQANLFLNGSFWPMWTGSTYVISYGDGRPEFFPDFYRALSETPRARLMKAFRYGVKDQTDKVRDDAPPIIHCPVLHSDFPKSECDVDHVAPWTFVNIVDAWLLAGRVTAEKVAGDVSTFTLASDYDKPVFINSRVQQHFNEFHRKHATLRMLSAFANRRMQADLADD